VWRIARGNAKKGQHNNHHPQHPMDSHSIQLPRRRRRRRRRR
jgi:hypothetical protein